MTLRPSSEPSAVERILRWLALVAVSVDAVIVPVARLTPLLTEASVLMLTIASAGILAALFIKALFEPACRRAVDATNKEMQGDKPFQLRWIPLRSNLGRVRIAVGRRLPDGGAANTSCRICPSYSVSSN
jgi:hypothetical protein